MKIKKAFCLFLVAVLLCGCAPFGGRETTGSSDPSESTGSIPTVPKPTVPKPAPTMDEKLDAIVESMSLEEQVGQLFLARCPAQDAIADIGTYHLGGYILFSRDFDDETVLTMQRKLLQYQGTSKIPMLLAVDEEGGTVNRVSSHPDFRETPFPSPRSLYAQGGLGAVIPVETEKMQLLSSLGLNVNMAPVCDITTDPEAFMYDRSLGASPYDTAQYVQAVVALMQQYNVGSVLKHFPGYWNNTDTHTGIATDSRSLDELLQSDLVPFQAGIQAGCGAILVSHTIVTAIDGKLPATLSPIVHLMLRKQLGFDGVIVTDDLAMQAITSTYGAEEAAVLAVLAGNDLLCSSDYAVQYAAVLDAAKSGKIPPNVLHDAVKRVLNWKFQLNLIDPDRI